MALVKRLSVGVWLDTRLFDDTPNLEELGKFMLCLMTPRTEFTNRCKFGLTILRNYSRK